MSRASVLLLLALAACAPLADCNGRWPPRGMHSAAEGWFGGQCVGATELTHGEFKRLGPASELPVVDDGCDECAVSGLTWADAVVIANMKSTAAGLPACYDLSTCARDGTTGHWACAPAPPPPPADCSGYRLPTARLFAELRHVWTDPSYEYDRWWAVDAPVGDILAVSKAELYGFGLRPAEWAWDACHLPIYSTPSDVPLEFSVDSQSAVARVHDGWALLFSGSNLYSGLGEPILLEAPGDIEFCRNVDKTQNRDGRGMGVRFVRNAWLRRDCDDRTIADVIYGRSAADNAAAAR